MSWQNTTTQVTGKDSGAGKFTAPPTATSSVTPKKGRARELSLALAFASEGENLLRQVQQALERMNKLAVQAQFVSDEERPAVDGEYRDLAGVLQAISIQKFNGVALFSGETWNVDIGAGDKLVLGGVPLRTENFVAVTSADLSTPPLVIQIVGNLHALKTEVSRGQALAAANTARLTFWSKQCDVEAEPPEPRIAQLPVAEQDRVEKLVAHVARQTSLGQAA